MKNEIFHIIFHFFAPLIVINFYVIFFKSIEIENFLIILLGSFFPDIDHVIYFKYKKNIKDFLKFNIFSDRYRKELLIFHNIFFMFFLLILIFFSSLYSINLFLFFLSFFLHLLIDFLDDKFMIGTVSHWKKGR